MDIETLELAPREITGKKVKGLRREGLTPVHLYGKDLDSGVYQVDALLLQRLLPRVGTNIPLSIKLKGKRGENICFVREVQRHPVTENVLHVDFIRVDVSQTVRAEVPILLSGNAPAARELGGTLLQPLQSITVESLPMNVPPSFELDVTGLDDFEKGLYVRDLPTAAEVTFLTDPDELIARVSPPRIEVVEEEEVEELEEGAEEGEGAAVAAVAEEGSAAEGEGARE